MEFVKIVCIAYLLKGNYCSGKQDEPKIFVYPEDYKHDTVPSYDNKGSQPFEVRIDVIVWSINELSLQGQDMEVDLMVNMFWIDPRLKRNPNVNSTRPWVLLGQEAHDVWKPRLLFRNCKGCKPVSMDPKDTAIYVDAQGQMWAEIRTLVRFTCAIDLSYYPMDHQTCSMQMFLIEEYNDVIVLKHHFTDLHKQSWSNLTISEFWIPEFISGDCTFRDFYNYTYSCIEVIVLFERLLAYHVMTSYAPTTFIVILSWISFWLSPSAVPARVALGLTSLLTLATRLDQAQRNLPPVSYVKAIDVWMFACITLVSTSLLEFAISHYKYPQQDFSTVRNSEQKPHTVKVQPKPITKEDVKPKTPKPQLQQDRRESPIDRACRIAFPVSFVFFNIVYWSYFLPGP